MKGYDVVAYFADGRPVKGTANDSYQWQGATWRFASPEHRAAFMREPAEYAPQYGGYCAYAVAQGNIVDIDPKQWKIVDGKLYLNANFLSQTLWVTDPAGHIKNGDANWRIIPRRPPKSIAVEPYPPIVPPLRPSHVCFRRRGRPPSVRIALEQEPLPQCGRGCGGVVAGALLRRGIGRLRLRVVVPPRCPGGSGGGLRGKDRSGGGMSRRIVGRRAARFADTALDGALLDRLKGFYRALGTRDAFVHLTQIYALDSGVCIVLSALRGEGRPVGRNSTLAAILGRILHDEVGHVRDSGRIARELGPRRAGTEHVARTREGLADMIFQRADALETLEVDPDALRRTLLHVPAWRLRSELLHP